MGYRHAAARPAQTSRHRRLLARIVSGLSGFALGAVGAAAAGLTEALLPVAGVAIVAAIVVGAASASGNRPVGAAYFPRTDGSWMALDGSPHDPSVVTGGSFAGGHAALTVCARRPSGRRLLRHELLDVTVAVVPETGPAYRTSLHLVAGPGAERLLAAGTTHVGGLFEPGRPDVALVVRPTAAQRAVLRRAVPPGDAAALPMRETGSHRRIRVFSSLYLAFKYERPAALWHDVRARAEWGHYAALSLLFCGTAAATALAASAWPRP